MMSAFSGGPAFTRKRPSAARTPSETEPAAAPPPLKSKKSASQRLHFSSELRPSMRPTDFSFWNIFSTSSSSSDAATGNEEAVPPACARWPLLPRTGDTECHRATPRANSAADAAAGWSKNPDRRDTESENDVRRPVSCIRQRRVPTGLIEPPDVAQATALRPTEDASRISIGGRSAITRIPSAVIPNATAAIQAGAQRSAVHPPRTAPPMAINAKE